MYSLDYDYSVEEGLLCYFLTMESELCPNSRAKRWLNQIISQSISLKTHANISEPDQALQIIFSTLNLLVSISFALLYKVKS